jgi:hypothetical protein
MNPDQAWIGKVLFVGIVGLVIWAITALLQANGEGARRARRVLGGALVLAIGAILLAIGGPGLLAIVVVVGGAGVWIFKGIGK